MLCHVKQKTMSIGGVLTKLVKIVIWWWYRARESCCADEITELGGAANLWTPGAPYYRY